MVEFADPHKSFYCPYSGRSFINQWLSATKTIDGKPVSWKKLVSFVKKGNKSGLIQIGDWLSITVKADKIGKPLLRLILCINETIELEQQYPTFLYTAKAIFCMLARNNFNATVVDPMIVTTTKCYSFTPHVVYPDVYHFMIQSLTADEFEKLQISEATKSSSSQTSDWSGEKTEVLNPPDYDSYFKITVLRKEPPVVNRCACSDSRDPQSSRGASRGAR